jgi:transcriptional regulator with XRE-family HTH domain
MTGPTEFCRNLTSTMAHRGWTTADLADRLCASWNTQHESARRRVRRYLSGAQSPKLETVELFAQVLGISPRDLAFGPRKWGEL